MLTSFRSQRNLSHPITWGCVKFSSLLWGHSFSKYGDDNFYGIWNFRGHLIYIMKIHLPGKTVFIMKRGQGTCIRHRSNVEIIVIHLGLNISKATPDSQLINDCPESKDPRIDVDWTSIRHESVGLISIRRRSKCLRYLYVQRHSQLDRKFYWLHAMNLLLSSTLSFHVLTVNVKINRWQYYAPNVILDWLYGIIDETD